MNDVQATKWAAVKDGLEKQSRMHSELNGYLKEGEKMQNIIDLLRNLNAELNAHRDGHLTGTLKKLLSDLKEKEINFSIGDDLSEGKISGLESWSSAKIGKLDSDLQTLLRAKISPLQQAIRTTTETLHKDYLESLQCPEPAP